MDKLPPNFCFSPWTNLDINPDGAMRPCCKYDFYDNPNNLYTTTIEEYKNSEFLVNLKKDFLNGVRNEGCARCWKEEKQNIKSKRLLDIDRWGDIYNDLAYDEHKFLTLSIAMGNVCNLKCRICSSVASSKWIKEEKHYTGVKNKVHDFYKEDRFIDQIKNLIHDAINIDWPGGEPLVTGNDKHLEILDYIIENGKSSQVALHYITNTTIYPDEKFFTRWKKFKKVEIQFSIDGMDKHFEYNRHPAKWNESYSNIKKYQQLEKENENIVLSIAQVLSVFTVYYLPEFYQWCIDEGLPKPWISRLNKPAHYQMGIFPTESKQKVKEKLLSSDIKEVRKWADEVYMHDSSENLSTFWEYTNRIDEYRKESFKNTFPEIYKLLRLPS